MQAQKLIRQWADDGGRKMSWVAAQVPVAGSSFSRWMTGRVIPSAVYRHRIADITGIEEAREEGNWISQEAMA